MNKEQAIKKSKEFRKAADDLLQQMKAHKSLLMTPTLPSSAEDDTPIEHPDDIGEAIAQHTLSIRDLESCIMRQGMTLKYIGNPNPYPESKNPESSVVEPAAGGLKL